MCVCIERVVLVKGNDDDEKGMLDELNSIYIFIVCVFA